MPRGRVKFNTASPKHPDWPGKPERALADLARRHNATYIPKTYHTTKDGKVGWALIETVEPEPESKATDFYGLMDDFDAKEITLLLSPESWLAQQGLPPEV
jgi:hypothetical protein